MLSFVLNGGRGGVGHALRALFLTSALRNPDRDRTNWQLPRAMLIRLKPAFRKQCGA